MGRLAVVVTSPRIPAGLLTPAAWHAIERADLVAAEDAEAPLVVAVRTAGVAVSVIDGATAADLLALAASRDVVWLAGDDGSPSLTSELAGLVVRRSELSDAADEGAAGAGRAGGTDPEVEIVVGSFDPVGARLLDAVTVMDTLRRECPWDREQTHESLTPYLVEETYEVLDAIEAMHSGAGEPKDLREELGDLLLQVLFHARLAAEHDTDPFTIDDVAETLVAKLVRRHPHVFADTQVSGADDVAANWEQIKWQEKGRASVVDGIPAGLPALSLADSVIGRALRVKRGVSVPIPDGTGTYDEATLGEVLFALVAAAHAGGLDAERALRGRVRQEMAALRDAEAQPAATPADPPAAGRVEKRR